MAGVEIKRKTRLTRKEVGKRLTALGHALSAGPDSELELDGDTISFTVADEVNWEFELEVDGDEVELEIELKWSQAAPATSAAPPPATPPAPAKRARSTRRGQRSD